MMKFLKIFQNLDNSISYLFSNTCNEEKFLKSFLKKKNIRYIDAGGNLGGYIDFLEKNFDIKSAYIFEPSKECSMYLRKNYNKKYSIINQALSNKKSKRIFYENEVLSQSSLIKKKIILIKTLK